MECKRCGHEASSLWNLKNHLNRVIPCPDHNYCGKSPAELLKEITIDKSDCEFACDKCGAKYKSRQGLYYHEKNNKCTVKDVMNHANTVGNSSGNISIVNSTGTIVNSPGAVVINNVNIIINNFGDEKIDYIIKDKEFMNKNMDCIGSTGMLNIINKIYNDNEYPENKTVHSQNKKANTFKIKQEQKWVTAHATTVIPAMLKKGYEVATKYFYSDPEAVKKR